MSSIKKTAAAIKRHRTAQLARLVTRSYVLHKRGKDERMYTMICNEFVELGGVYIKFLQGVLLRSKALSKWNSPDRLRIFENVQQEPMNLTAILQHELKPEQLAQLASIQPQPFAAGSFGQVYYGQHRNGKPIIVKILRPMVRELLRYDLRLLSVFSKRFFSKLYPNMDVNIESAIKDFVEATMRETDYIAEATFADELYQHHKGHKSFIIPETFLSLCTPNLIVQEYVDGISVAQLVTLMQQGVDPKDYIREVLDSDLDTQLETLGYESLHGIFNLPRIQGDPHPGNVRLMTNDRVGLIDFGIAANTPQNKAAFFGLLQEWNGLYQNNQNIVRLFEQFMRFFVSDLYRALKKLSSFNRSTADTSNYTEQIGQVAHESFKQFTGGQNIDLMSNDSQGIMKVLNEIVNKDNRFGLVMKIEASEILRAAQTYITLVETLGRRNEVLPKVFQRIVTNVKAQHPELSHEGDDTMNVSDAVEVVSGWLERVAQRDPALFRELMGKIRMKTDPKPAQPKPAPVNEGVKDA